MVIVYGVARGEYSDYRVAAIFSTREKAVAYIEKLRSACRCTDGNDEGDDSRCWYCETARVEEFDFDPDEVPK